MKTGTHTQVPGPHDYDPSVSNPCVLKKIKRMCLDTSSLSFASVEFLPFKREV